MANALIEQKANIELIAYFGYGSLVNRKTLPENIIDAIPVTLKGWRRHWQSRPNEKIGFGDDHSIALLGIHPEPSSAIDGLLIIDRAENQEALDIREVSYQKIKIEKMDFIHNNNALSEYSNLNIYTYLPPRVNKTAKSVKILRSYLNVVMQGFYREFDEAGVQRFLDSTDKFDLPIQEDRDTPLYPRNQKLTEFETKLFNRIFG